MNSSVNTMPATGWAGRHNLNKWAIRHRQTRALLSTHSNHRGRDGGISNANFIAATPILFASKKTAREAWIAWMVANAFIKRGITLPKTPYTFEVVKEPPEVDLVLLRLHPEAVAPFFLNEDADNAF